MAKVKEKPVEKEPDEQEPNPRDLFNEVSELRHDLDAVAVMLGKMFVGEFQKQVEEIVKRQQAKK